MSSEGHSRPMAVVDQDGVLLGMAAWNDRAHKTSIESGSLWVIHPDAGRVLPYDGGADLIDIEDHGDWVRARVRTGALAEGNGRPAATAEQEQPGGGSGRPRETGAWQVLEDLTATVRDRHSRLPKGSYTTYLFEQGLDKIRKKTAEEAVELALARSQEDMVCEAADLLYHLLVFLEAAGIDPQRVRQELRRRE